MKTNHKLMHILKKIIAWLLIAFGAFMTLGGVVRIAESQTQGKIIENILVTCLIGGLPATLGIFWLMNMRKRNEKFLEKKTEKTILQLAERFDGQLTILQVASNTDLSAQEAKDVLENMYRRNVAEFNIGESGQIIYVFRDFLKD